MKFKKYFSKTFKIILHGHMWFICVYIKQALAMFNTKLHEVSNVLYTTFRIRESWLQSLRSNILVNS